MLKLCVLGTGGALPLPDRGLSACYLRANGRGFLIDCGEGTQTAIRRLGWGFRCIDGMLITAADCPVSCSRWARPSAKRPFISGAAPGWRPW